MTTPFDHFVRDATVWLDSVWYVWIVLAVALVILAASVALTKARARAKRRIPQYRRHAHTS